MIALVTSAAPYSLTAYLGVAVLIGSSSLAPQTRLQLEEPVERTANVTFAWGRRLGSTYREVEADAFSSSDCVVDNLVEQIVDFKKLLSGWDGEEACVANRKAVREAICFLRLAGRSADQFEPSLHVDGSVILEIDDSANGSLRFRGDGRILCAVKNFDAISIVFDSIEISPNLQEMLDF